MEFEANTQCSIDGEEESKTLLGSKTDFRRRPTRQNSYTTYITYSLLAFALWSSSIYCAVKVATNLMDGNHHCTHNIDEMHENNEAKSHSTDTGLVPVDMRLSCGSSSAEAEALGCVFDPLMASWLPKDCPSYGREEFAKVIEQSNLSYHYEENGKPTGELIDMKEFPHMDGVMYWGTVMEHLTHCVYTLKRIIYTQHEHARFDTVTGNFSHTDHCVEFLIMGLKSHPDVLETELYRTDEPVSFLEC